MNRKEVLERDLRELVRLAKEHTTTALTVFFRCGGKRLGNILVKAFSNGITTEYLEKEIAECLRIHHGPPPEYLINKFYEELWKERMPHDFVEGIKTHPNGLCLGTLCRFDGQPKLPLEEIVEFEGRI